MENPGNYPDFDDPYWDDVPTDKVLLEATVWVLAEQGHQGLTIRRVADRAGLNRGLIHYYFDSKHDLLLSLLDHILEGMETFLQLDNETPPVEQLWSVLEFLAFGPDGIEDKGRHYNEAIIQLHVLAPYDPEIRQRLTRNYQFTIDLLRSIVERGIDEGVFQPVDSEQLAVFLISTINGARHADLTLDIDTRRETVLQHLKRVIPVAPENEF